MRKIILEVAVSLDGFIEGPNGEYDWCIMEPEMGFDAFLDSVDTIFFGRKSYELFGSRDPESFGTEEERQLFRRMEPKQQYVFSLSKTAFEGKATVIGADFESRVAEIKAQPGKDIWLFGGAGLAGTLIKTGLIDEIHLGVHPLFLGEGKPLFEELKNRVNLKLVANKTYPSGVVGLYYETIRQ